MKTLVYSIILFLIALFFSSVEKDSYEILERTLPAVLGACLGGVLACTSIMISVLSGSSKQTKQKAKDSQKFFNFISSLERDLKLLVVCLFLVVVLPYLRTLDYPLSLSIFELNPSYLKHKAFSTLEIFFASIAFILIFELVTVLVDILKNMMIIHDTDV